MAAREPGRGRQVNEGPTDYARRPLTARAHDPPLLARTASQWSNPLVSLRCNRASLRAPRIREARARRRSPGRRGALWPLIAGSVGSPRWEGGPIITGTMMGSLIALRLHPMDVVEEPPNQIDGAPVQQGVSEVRGYRELPLRIGPVTVSELHQQLRFPPD